MTSGDEQPKKAELTTVRVHVKDAEGISRPSYATLIFVLETYLLPSGDPLGIRGKRIIWVRLTPTAPKKVTASLVRPLNDGDPDDFVFTHACFLVWRFKFLRLRWEGELHEFEKMGSVSRVTFLKPGEEGNCQLICPCEWHEPGCIDSWIEDVITHTRFASMTSLVQSLAIGRSETEQTQQSL